MESVDILGDRPELRRVVSRELLAENEDAVLGEIVRQAADELGTPIALVTLLLDQIQFFKAHYGLPPDLQAARGTERDVSFCQFVVRDAEPFEVNDAFRDTRVPKHVVDEYGIRSYLGMPISVGDTVVGSLCVIDTEARSFSDEERSSLEKLARLVNVRLEELAKRRQRARWEATDDLSATALSELHESLMPVFDAVGEGIQAATAMRAFLGLFEFFLSDGNTSRRTLDRSFAAATKAAEKNLEILNDIDAAARDCEDCIRALTYLAAPSKASRLSELLEASQDLVRPRTRPAGGAPLPDMTFDPIVSTSRWLGVAFVALCLGRLADQMVKNESSNGIQMKVVEVNGHARLEISGEGVPDDAVEELNSDLQGRLEGDPSLRIGSADGTIFFEFTCVK